MAVRHVETFTFELPLGAVEMEGPRDSQQVIVTMDRAGLTRLYADLAEALGNDRPMPGDTFAEEAIFMEPYPGTARLSVEEAAAQAQIAAKQAERMQHTANANQPRGSAIGNQHV